MFGAVWLRNHTALSDQLSCLGQGARVTSPREEHSSGEGLWSHSGFNASIWPTRYVPHVTPLPGPAPASGQRRGYSLARVRAEQRAEETGALPPGRSHAGSAPKVIQWKPVLTKLVCICYSPPHSYAL